MRRTQIVLAAAGLTAVAVAYAQPAPPAPAGSMPTSASQPAEEEIDRWTIDSEVAESLHDADLCRRAAEVAARPMPTDVRELFCRLNLFLRAGYSAPVRGTIAALGAARIHVTAGETDRWSWHQIETRRPLSVARVEDGDLAEIARGLLVDREFELAQFLLETFPQVGYQPELIEHWEQSGWSQEQIDRWLVDRASAWPWGWVPWRAAFLARHKSAEPLLRSLAEGVRAAPADAIRAMIYLKALEEARRAAESAESPEGAETPEPPKPPEPPDWMGDVCRPTSALALRDLADALYPSGAIRGSRALYELALTTKLSEEELDWMASSRQQWCSWRQAEIGFRLDVLRQLAWEKELDDAAAVERHAREAEALQAELDQIELENAARMQASAAQATQKGGELTEFEDVYKSLARAKEHAKRAEHDAAVEAFEAALSIAPQYIGRWGKGFGVRAEVIRDYGLYLLRAQGLKPAHARLQKEIAEAPRDSDSAHMAVSLLIGSEFAHPQSATERPATAPTRPQPRRESQEPVLDPRDDVLWSYLEKTSYWDYAEERLMTILLQALPKSEREMRMSQLEDLARAKSLSRAAACGRVLLQEGAPERAIPLLERAVAGFGRRGYGSAVSDLCAAYLKINDWRRAEGLLSGSSCPDAILRAAAREGAFDDALRLWRRRTNFDLRDLEMLPELAQLGMREQLRAFYRELGEKCPESWVPARALAILAGGEAP